MVKFLLGGGVDESSVSLRNASEDVDAAATAVGCTGTATDVTSE